MGSRVQASWEMFGAPGYIWNSSALCTHSNPLSSFAASTKSQTTNLQTNYVAWYLIAIYLFIGQRESMQQGLTNQAGWAICIWYIGVFSWLQFCTKPTWDYLPLKFHRDLIVTQCVGSSCECRKTNVKTKPGFTGFLMPTRFYTQTCIHVPKSVMQLSLSTKVTEFKPQHSQGNSRCCCLRTKWWPQNRNELDWKLNLTTALLTG